MAALDFGMALARGMLPKAETAQKDLLNLAGGRNVFKSEDWWNKAVDKQISEGYREVERTAKDYLMPTGEYQREKTQTSFQSGRYTTWGNMSYFVPGPSYSLFGAPAQGRTLTSYAAPEGAVKQGGQFVTRDIPIFGTQREDFTAGELSDIESAAKRGAEQAKRTSAETKSSKRRLSRATGGLMGKARQPGDAPVTGLPSLGEGGLGVEGSILGGAFKL
jgi:hypothetical protein